MTKKTLYDYLEISVNASGEMVSHAYNLKRENLLSKDQNSDDVKNEILFVTEAWTTLSDPQLRKSYDEKLALGDRPVVKNDPVYVYDHYETANQNVFLEWWDGSKVSKLLIAFAIFVAIVFVYKFNGEKERIKLEQKRLEIEAQKMTSAAARDAERVQLEIARLENARVIAERTEMRQERLLERDSRVLDRSLDLANRRENRADRGLEVDAATTSTVLEMEQARLEMQKQKQLRAEKESQRRDAELVHKQNRLELCRIYKSKNQDVAVRDMGGC